MIYLRIVGKLSLAGITGNQDRFFYSLNWYAAVLDVADRNYISVY